MNKESLENYPIKEVSVKRLSEDPSLSVVTVKDMIGSTHTFDMKDDTIRHATIKFSSGETSNLDHMENMKFSEFYGQQLSRQVADSKDGTVIKRPFLPEKETMWDYYDAGDGWTEASDAAKAILPRVNDPKPEPYNDNERAAVQAAFVHIVSAKDVLRNILSSHPDCKDTSKEWIDAALDDAERIARGQETSKGLSR